METMEHYRGVDLPNPHGFSGHNSSLPLGSRHYILKYVYFVSPSSDHQFKTRFVWAFKTVSLLFVCSLVTYVVNGLLARKEGQV